MDIQLTEINIYPVKSLAGISIKESILEDTGLQYDRRWMLVDENGRFLSQRKHPKMALAKTRIISDQLIISVKDFGELNIDKKLQTGEKTTVEVWDDHCEAVFLSDQYDQWFSEFLDFKCRLVYMPNDSNRIVDTRYNPDGKIVSFADGYPNLLISEASLADLNTRLDSPVPMNRFRPNLVVNGTLPYAEDSWDKIKIGEIDFTVAKPCARCVLTTIDQENGQKGKEPLKTLSSYRKKDKKIYFGQNLLHANNGILKLGNSLNILKSKISMI
ncbi:MOSC domain-containing protein [Flexithrix dorotheae]|uniref:MOSC domain-containing protein n=1 Tax=Flexithrix dorotheae TaxID=70993 RepID=UPI0003784834|nr:MOSC N-terminal beta barrel domain-containing protein [Flexithrix dorotheae]